MHNAEQVTTLHFCST